MFIPGQVIALLTFPGVIIHEIAHRFFADISGVEVYSIKYFQLQKVAGYVQHGEIKTSWQAFLICVGPFIINSALCMILTLPFAYHEFLLGARDTNIIVYFLGWLGISIGMHAFPSNQDMMVFAAHAHKLKANIFIKVFAHLLQVLVFLSNMLRIFYFDAIYAVGISTIIPILLERI